MDLRNAIQRQAAKLAAAEGCQTCGMDHGDDEQILGNQGCPRCGRTRPYLVRPTREGRIHFGNHPSSERSGAHWLQKRPGPEGDSWSEQRLTHVKKKDDGSWYACSYGPDNDYHEGRGRTQVEAVHGVMHHMAAATGKKWWPTDKGWHDKLDKLQGSD